MYPRTKQKRPNIKFFSLVLAAMVLFAFSGCGKSVEQKIIGKWSSEKFEGLGYNFTESGEMITLRGASPGKTEKYRLVNDETMEVETAEGKKVKLKISFTDDNTLNTLDERGNKLTFRRQ